ncbi:MAG: HAMP domain-containing histidine kinase [Streptococcaceae bacterium]|jgi:signal transduction histidine kinase|nr:HAMP domain-containing histidine kinase [Streptococcaceae bacterium]
MINKVVEAYSRKKGPSVTVKWALASALFIFILFTIFAVLTYNSSVSLIMSKEKENLERTVGDINRNLSQSHAELTTEEVKKQFNQKVLFSYDKENNSEILIPNHFLSEVMQSSISFYIYNAEKKIIFGTDDLPPHLIETKSIEPTVITLGNDLGNISVQPIRSEKTNKVIGYVQGILVLSSFSEIRDQLLTVLFVSEIFSFIFSGLIGFFLANYFLRPITILRNRMIRIKQDPKFEDEIEPINTHDELEDLAEIFEELMEKIRSHIVSLDQFVSDVSHELRTPVAIVEGHLKMLDRWGKSDPEVLDDSIKSSLQSIQRMKNLIQNMLELSRTGNIERYPDELTEVREVVDRTFNDFKVLYGEEFELLLENKLQFSDVALMNEERLEQLLVILLDNAIKYSGEIRKIEVKAWVNEDDRICISVKDNGEGIPKEAQAKIFDRFYRVDKARTNSQGGNGLGLSIACQIITAYKGEIKVESEVDEGTTFTIVLPKIV